MLKKTRVLAVLSPVNPPARLYRFVFPTVKKRKFVVVVIVSSPTKPRNPIGEDKRKKCVFFVAP
jgi:hypothetical protein